MADDVGTTEGVGNGLKWGAGAAAGAAVAVAIWYFGLRPAPETMTEATPPAAESTTGQAAPVTAAEPVTETAPEATPVPADNAPTTTEETTAGSTPEAAATAEAVTESAAPDTAAEPAAAPAAPSFDTVRVDADGSVLVAGRAEPDAPLVLYLDTAEVARATGDARGTFATLFTIPPSDAPRTLSLVRLMPDGTTVTSEETIIIAPFAAPAPPEVVAEAAPVEPGAALAPATEAPATESTADAVVPESPAGAKTTETATAKTPMPESQVSSAAPAAPEVLIADATGVRKQVIAESLAAIVIDTIGYGASGEVSISGRGTAGDFARVYLNNAAQGAAEIAQTGAWSVALNDVAAGVYTLRVDQVDASGKVTSRFETPFKRETPETVAAALAPTPPTEEAAALASRPAVTGGDNAAVPVAPDAAGPETATGVADTSATQDALTPAVRAGIVTVQPGFTLWRIARENYGDGVLYVKVFEANKDQIRNPDLIYPGQIFTVPAE
jgi:LysM repeat protein